MSFLLFAFVMVMIARFADYRHSTSFFIVTHIYVRTYLLIDTQILNDLCIRMLVFLLVGCFRAGGWVGECMDCVWVEEVWEIFRVLGSLIC